jgi:hypothetical protein
VLFPSITFLFYFLPLFFLIYWLSPGITAKNLVLLIAHLERPDGSSIPRASYVDLSRSKAVTSRGC